MTFKEQFKVGDLVKMNESRESPTFHVTKIIAIEEKKDVFVVHSISKELLLGAVLTVKREFNDMIFLFTTKVLATKEKDGKGILTLEIPKHIDRIQRREFYRLPLQVKISLKNSENKLCLGETIDISGTGINLELNSKLEINEIISLTLNITDDFILENMGGIVKRGAKGNKLPYRYGINFIYIDTHTQEQLVAHIFKVQKMLLSFSKNI